MKLSLRTTTRLALGLLMVSAVTACDDSESSQDNLDTSRDPGTEGTNNGASEDDDDDDDDGDPSEPNPETDAGMAGPGEDPDDGNLDAGTVTEADAGATTDEDASVAEPDAGEPALTATLGRLLVADSDPENPRFTVVDLDDGKVVSDFPALGNALVYSSGPSAGYAWANQRVAGRVEIVASGISADADGSVHKQAPWVLGERFEGKQPTHWVSHEPWIVSFNDGDGSFDFVREATLGTDRLLMHRATTGKAHHGVAVISHGNVFATLPHPMADSGEPGPGSAYILPVGVTVRRIADPNTVAQQDGAPLQSDLCPLLHGEAANDDVVAFGCGDGLLMAERKEGKFTFRKLNNPEGTPAGRRIGTVRAFDGVARLYGNWGNGFVMIPYHDESPTWKAVDLGSPNLGFLIEPKDQRLVVLAGDGSLRLFDSDSAEPVGTPLAGVVDAWVAGAARPALTVGHGFAFVADPRTGLVHEVDLGTWTKTRSFAVGGKPGSVAAFGRWPAVD